jgi:thiol-disulfide isomerase/thioredoxin
MMKPIQEAASTLTERQSQAVQQFLQKFQQAWGPTAFQDWVERLPRAGSPLRHAALLGLAQVDIQQRWLRGEQVLLERYLEQFPELGGVKEPPTSLVLAECAARRRADAGADLGAVARRFSLRVDELERLLGLFNTDVAIAADGPSGERETRVFSRSAPPPSPNLVSEKRRDIPSVILDDEEEGEDDDLKRTTDFVHPELGTTGRGERTNLTRPRRWSPVTVGLILLLGMGTALLAAWAVYRVTTDRGDPVARADGPGGERVADQPAKQATTVDPKPLPPREPGGAPSRPRLVVKGVKNVQLHGLQFTEYLLSIENHSDFPDALFKPAPDLPPCGMNPNSSQTWVDIYSSSGQRLKGYCMVKSASNLQELPLAVRTEIPPPDAVYVVLHDRRADVKYTSNPATLPQSPKGPEATRQPPRAAPVRNQMLSGLAHDGQHLWSAIYQGQGRYLIADLKEKSWKHGGSQGSIREVAGSFGSPGSICLAEGHLWVGSSSGDSIGCIDVKTWKVKHHFKGMHRQEKGGQSYSGIAHDGKHLWVAWHWANYQLPDSKTQLLLKLDPQTAKVLAEYPLPPGTRNDVSHGLAWDGQTLWHAKDQRLASIDPSTGRVTATHALQKVKRPSGLAWDGQALWIVEFGGALWRLPLQDGKPGDPEAVIKAGGEPVKPVAQAPTPEGLLDRPALPIEVITWVHGTPYRWEQLRGKVVLIDFWAAWCPPCVRGLPHLTHLHEKYAKDGLVILGLTRPYGMSWNPEDQTLSRETDLAPEKEQESIAAFAGHKQLRHSIGFVSDPNAWKAYGVKSIPQAVLIDRQGVVRMIQVGSSEETQTAVEARIRQLLGHAPEPMDRP